MCKSARRTPGTAEREASVADLIASEARRDRASGRVSTTSDSRTETPLCAFSQAIDRESLAGLGNYLKSFQRTQVAPLQWEHAFSNFS